VAAGYDVLFSPMIHQSVTITPVDTAMRSAFIIVTPRNELWSTVMRCPFPFAVESLAGAFSRSFVMPANAAGPGHSGTQLVVAGAGWNSVLC